MRTLLPKDLETVSLTVCAHFDLKPSELRKETRDQRIVKPRQLAWYLLYNRCGASLTGIAEAFDKDFGTVRHGLKAVRNRAMTDAQFAAALYALDSRCKILLEAK